MLYDPAERGLDALTFEQKSRSHLRVAPQLTGSYIIDLYIIGPFNEQHRETSPEFFVSRRAFISSWFISIIFTARSECALASL